MAFSTIMEVFFSSKYWCFHYWVSKTEKPFTMDKNIKDGGLLNIFIWCSFWLQLHYKAVDKKSPEYLKNIVKILFYFGHWKLIFKIKNLHKFFPVVL